MLLKQRAELTCDSFGNNTVSLLVRVTSVGGMNSPIEIKIIVKVEARDTLSFGNSLYGISIIGESMPIVVLAIGIVAR